MQILNDSDREIVKTRFENELVDEVNITLFTQTDLGGLIVPGRECETCAPTEQLLREVSETSELINKELKNSDLPDEIRIGAVLRKNEIIIPRSNYIFQKDDIVVLLTKKDQLPIVENLFRLSSV